jgi:hypothetical protein
VNCRPSVLEFGAVGREIIDRLVMLLLGARLVMTRLELLLLGVRFVTTLLDVFLLELRLVIVLLELLLLKFRLDEMLLELLEEFDLDIDLDEAAGLETCRLELLDLLLERLLAAKTGS